MTSSWSLSSVAGSPPSPRDKMASAVIGCKIFYFGGFGPQGTMDSDDEVRPRHRHVHNSTFDLKYCFCLFGGRRRKRVTTKACSSAGSKTCSYSTLVGTTVTIAPQVFVPCSTLLSSHRKDAILQPNAHEPRHNHAASRVSDDVIRLEARHFRRSRCGRTNQRCAHIRNRFQRQMQMI